MFPYKLRAPVFGSVQENQRRKADATAFQELSLQGGPVQKAIVQDLVSFQQRVVTKLIGLLDDTTMPVEVDPVATTKSSTASGGGGRRRCGHFQQGVFFRRFQRAFGESKIALLHLLLPHPRCDTEAYTQLIYAAALQCFQQAMMERRVNHKNTNGSRSGPEEENDDDKDPNNQRILSLLKAIVTIFTLYALFETNPLLRADSLSPEQWLPVGLQNRENSRALYRRAFRQPIRINADCFSLVLQLGQWCLAEKAQCQRRKIQEQQEQEETAARKWCTCGMAGDALGVLQRLFPHWEFCDYTGPVGLEALAGHQDYTSTAVSEPTMATTEQSLDPPIDVHPTTIQLSLDDATSKNQKDVTVAMKEYAASLEAVTKGMVVRPTSARASSQWQQVLVTTLLSEKKESWNDIVLTRNVVRQQTTSAENTARQQAGGSRDNATLQEDDSVKPEGDGGLDVSQHVPENDVSSGINSVPVSMSDELTLSMKQNLASIFQLIQQREGPQFFHATPRADVSVSNTLQEEDVSTLGVGGVSVATGQGRAALEALLSSVPLSKVPMQVLPSNRKRDSDRTLAVPVSGLARVERFLQGTESSSDDQESDSEASAMSNLSESEDEEDNQEEETSVATSAAGKQALEALLSRVSGGAPKKPRRVRQPRNKKSTMKRSAVAKKQDSTKGDDTDAMETDTDIGSTAASSVGPGEHALRSLLQMSAANGPSNTVKTSQRSMKQTSTPTDDPDNDTGSLATLSIGPGEHALRSLLQRSAGNPPDSSKSHPKHAARSGNPKKSNRKVTGENDRKNPPKRGRPRGNLTKPTKRQKTLSSEQSVGSSVGAGEHALTVLLGQLDGKTEASTPPPEDNETTKIAPVDNETSSVASSSVGGGQQALLALLSKGRTSKH